MYHVTVSDYSHLGNEYRRSRFRRYSTQIIVHLPCRKNLISIRPDCISLSVVVIPTSVTNIGVVAFAGTSHLVIIVLKLKNKMIIVRCSSLLTVIIPTSVSNIGNDSFNGENNLVINYLLFVINLDAIHPGCSSLSTVVIPTSVSSVGNDSFSGTNHLVIVVSSL